MITVVMISIIVMMMMVVGKDRDNDDDDDIDDDIVRIRMIKREPGTPSGQNLCPSDLNKYSKCHCKYYNTKSLGASSGLDF